MLSEPVWDAARTGPRVDVAGYARPDFTSRIVHSIPLTAMAGLLTAAITLALCVAGIPVVLATACLITSVIIAVGGVVPLLIDQGQRVQIVRKVLGKIDSVYDAVKLLNALAPPSRPAVDARSSSPRKP